jgi:hypothetical protein
MTRKYEDPVGGWMLLAVGMTLLAAGGCKSDLNQQLLERELRFQEDQIYCLQDELQSSRLRLDRVASENASLRRQLGIVDDAGPAPAPSPAAPPAVGPEQIPPPMLVPPTVDAPPVGTAPGGGGDPGPRFGPTGADPPSSIIAPPTLEGVPPLPDEPSLPSPNRGAAATEIRRLSFDESVAATGRLTHLVVNPDVSRCYDADGDGISEGITVVFEPRDADERLVTAAGDVSISVFDVANPTQPLAVHVIPAADAAGHFRRTSRARGLHFVLPWTGQIPTGSHVRLRVEMTSFDGAQYEAESTVAVGSTGITVRDLPGS